MSNHDSLFDTMYGLDLTLHHLSSFFRFLYVAQLEEAFWKLKILLLHQAPVISENGKVVFGKEWCHLDGGCYFGFAAFAYPNPSKYIFASIIYLHP